MGNSASVLPRCSSLLPPACAQAAASTASIRPSDDEAISTENTGSTLPIMMSKPPPSAPSMFDAARRTALAVNGEERLPRRPMPSKGLTSERPAHLLSTSHKVLAPGAATGLVDQTYESAWPAAVTMLLLPSITIASPSLRALPAGAQKWLRVPVSDQARVLRWRPAAISARTFSLPVFSSTVVALRCMHTTMAVDGHDVAMRSIIWAASVRPSPIPPTLALLIRPSKPAWPRASMAARGNCASRSTAFAAGAMVAAMMSSSCCRYGMASHV